MMRALALLLLTGCSGYQVEAGCLTFTAYEPIDAAALRSNVQLAEEILRPLGVADFCGSFARVAVTIHATDGWDCRPVNPSCRVACTITCTAGLGNARGVWLERTGSRLAHELLHAWEDQRGIATAEHPSWEERGYYAADFAFQDAFTPLVGVGAAPASSPAVASWSMSPITLLIVIFLVLLLVGAFPAWPHSRSWGYAPVSVGGIVLVLFVIWLLFFGGLQRLH